MAVIGNPEALDQARTNRFGRVIYEDSPRGTDYRAAQTEVDSIRSELSRLRMRLERLQLIESEFPFDSTALSAAGALTCVIHTLYSLQEGERSFRRRAERIDELWADIYANPEKYVLRPKDEKAKRDWRDWTWLPMERTKLSDDWDESERQEWYNDNIK